MKRLVILLGALTLPLLAEATSTIDLNNNSAWGANIGWTNWRTETSISLIPKSSSQAEFVCSVYVYASNAGWINLGGGAD